ncbi:MAG TPA: hypothetical protein VEQ59_07600 [Polyangiaceae bacterium]|nr:hypothetical protein [Polyangiaceae bacterium]
MRSAEFAVSLVSTLAVAFLLTGCDGCNGSADHSLSAKQRDEALASAIESATVGPAKKPVDGIGHPANVIPGQGPKRIEFPEPRAGAAMPILPGQGIGPIRFGATKATIERLMGAPCDDSTDTMCRYVGRAVEFTLENGAAKEMRISRKGREAKRAPDGSIIEYGFFSGALLPDLYFGMRPEALQEQLGPPQKVDKISPLGADGLAERHTYDGLTLEYDQWSNGNLVLGAVILTKSDTAAAKNEKAIADLEKRAAEAAERASKSRPTRVPR